MHRLDDMLGLGLHIPSQIRVDDILACHGAHECLKVQLIALDDPHPARIGILKPGGTAQIKRQTRIRRAQEHGRRMTGQLPVRAEDQDVGHGFVPSLMIRIAFKVRG